MERRRVADSMEWNESENTNGTMKDEWSEVKEGKGKKANYVLYTYSRG